MIWTLFELALVAALLKGKEAMHCTTSMRKMSQIVSLTRPMSRRCDNPPCSPRKTEHTRRQERLPITPSLSVDAANKGWVAIATRMTKRGPGPAPIQIQAQFLRDHPVSAPAGPLSGFAVTLDQESPVLPVEASACRDASWQEADVKRAIAAAEEAGLRSYRVEMASDGTVSIIVGP